MVLVEVGEEGIVEVRVCLRRVVLSDVVSNPLSRTARGVRTLRTIVALGAFPTRNSSCVNKECCAIGENEEGSVSASCIDVVDIQPARLPRWQRVSALGLSARVRRSRAECEHVKHDAEEGKNPATGA